MPEAKPKITMVGVMQAREGLTFVMGHPTKDCEKCELIGTCMNLKAGRVYRIVKIRNKMFPCRVHEEGVRVVEVEESPIEVAIEQKAAFLLSVIILEPKACRIRCINTPLCAPQGIRSGDKYQILEILGKVDCPLNKPLVRAIVKREESSLSSP
ncbi:MAG: UPF0179 family protein [Candidatus Bathyarchaeia archaeon]